MSSSRPTSIARSRSDDIACAVGAITGVDRERLNGYIHRVVQKESRGRDELLTEIGELIAGSTGARAVVGSGVGPVPIGL